MFKLLSTVSLIALSASALFAASAHAIEPIEVVHETAGGQEHCGGGVAECRIHNEGPAILSTHFFGVEATEATCHLEFEGTTNESGAGSILSMTFIPGDATCPTAMPPCAGSLPTPTTTEKITTDITEIAVASVCLDPTEVPTCEGHLDIRSGEETFMGAESQHWRFLNTAIGSGFCEINYSGESETDPLHPPLHYGN